MATVNWVDLKLQIPAKYAQLPFCKSLNGLSAKIVSAKLNWDTFFTLLVDAKTSEELKTFGFVIQNSARRWGRQHRLSEKIEEFINTFSEEQDVYTVYLRKYSTFFDSSQSPQGLRDPEMPTRSKINSNPIDAEISRSLPARSPAMSHGVLKRVSEQDHDDKPAKSTRLCLTPGTPADDLDQDGNESNASSDLLKDVEENEVDSENESNAEDFNENLGQNDGTKDQEGIGRVEEVQDESSVAGGVPGENVSGYYSDDAGGNNFGKSQEEDVDIEIEYVNSGKIPQIISTLSLEKEAEIRIQNLHEIGTIMEEIDDDEEENENSMDLNQMQMDGTVLDRIGIVRADADGQLNVENPMDEILEDQEEIRGEYEEVQDETSVAGRVLGENVGGNLVQGVGAGGNEFGNILEEKEYIDVETVDVDDDENAQINRITSQPETQIQTLCEISTSVEEINDNGNENSMDLNEKDGIGGGESSVNLEKSRGADKEPDNQGGVEKIIPENSTIKEEDENDDVVIIEVVNKSDSRPSRKRKVPNSEAEKCESRADVNIPKTENIPKEQTFEGEMEGKAKFLQELKNLSNDDFQVFQKELKQLNSIKGNSRSAFIGKAAYIFAFFFEFEMSSQTLQEFTDEVQNKLTDSEVAEISEEIKRLRNERELRNIFSPKLRLFLMECFC